LVKGPPPDEAKLSRNRIVTEALALVNTEGLAGMSLRKLARRLGVQAPSLYRHIPDKAALLSSMQEVVFERIVAEVPDHRHWRDWMRAFGESNWKVLDEVGDYSRLMQTTEISEDQLLRSIEFVRRRLRLLDIPEEESFRIQSSIQAVVTGWSAFAHAPYGKYLRRVLRMKELALADVDRILDGYAREQQTLP
jgi:TetR/AcrR family tetracycline transcriptional repressor